MGCGELWITSGLANRSTFAKPTRRHGLRDNGPLMQRTRDVSEFPWKSLDKLERSVERELWAARRSLERAGSPAAFASALGELLDIELSLHLRSIDARPPTAPLIRVGLAVADGGARCVIGLEPALAALLLSKLLRRPVPIVRSDTEFDAGLLGALSALLIEAARRTAPSAVLTPRDASARAGSPVVHLTAIAEGRPYMVALFVAGSWSSAEHEPTRAMLARLGALELALPLVVAQNLSTPAELGRLEVGAAWLPGAGWSVDAELCGQGILLPGDGEQGHSVVLGPAERIVLGEPTSAPLAAPEQPMVSPANDAEPSTLTDAVVEAPVVVRVELGTVSMKARDWASLKPGDVIETGRRIGQPVALRAGGRLLAHGELVNIEGELGVRVTQILPEGEP